IGVDNLVELEADMLGCERDHRGGAAERCRDCCAFESVGIKNTGRRNLFDMGMAVYAARKHQLATGVDLLRAGEQVAADSRNGFPLDRHVGRKYGRGGRNGAAAQYKIVGLSGHGLSPVDTNCFIRSLAGTPTFIGYEMVEGRAQLRHSTVP